MTTEKKTTKKKPAESSKKKTKDTSKIELVFTESEKEPCEGCKEPKEIELSLPKFTKDEMDRAMELIKKYRTNGEENSWLVNLNNRVNNDNKISSGCGKCMVQVKKNLTNAYQRLYG